MKDELYEIDYRVARRMAGAEWEYVACWLPDEDRAAELLPMMERGGWEVVNITGHDPGNDVIWFKRRLRKGTKAP